MSKGMEIGIPNPNEITRDDEALTRPLLSTTTKRRTYWETLRAGAAIQNQNHNDINGDDEALNLPLPRRTNWIVIVAAGHFLLIADSFKNTQPNSDHIIGVDETPLLNQEEPDHIIDVDETPLFNQEERHTINRFVKEKNLFSLIKFGGAEQVASVLHSNLKTGLIDQEISHTETLNGAVNHRYFFFLADAVFNSTVILLLVSAGLSFSIEVNEQGAHSGWRDGVSIIAAVIMIVTFNSVADFRRAIKEEKMLCERRNRLEFNVVRSGKSLPIAISKIVDGDIVHLSKGDWVPADGLFIGGIGGQGLSLDEKLNSKIDADKFPFLSSGSMVNEGSGFMIVTDVGAHTVMFDLHGPLEKTLLEIWINKATTIIDNLAPGVSILIATVVLIEVLSKKTRKDDNVMPELKGNFKISFLMKLFHTIFMRPRGTVSVLASWLYVFVIGFQHGMPLVITVSLFFWKQKFEDNQAIAQNLSACATIGVVTVLCVNATGGLVCNEVVINKFFIHDKDITNEEDSETHQVVLEALQQGICISSFVPKTPTDSCLVSWAGSQWGMDMKLAGQRFRVLENRKLSSNKEGRGVLVKTIGDHEEENMNCHWKGDALLIVGMCSHFYDTSGQCHAMGNQRDKFEQRVKDMENEGLRPIAFAYTQTEVEEIREHGLHLLALVGLKYHCLEEMKLAIESLNKEGVSIKLVSEDEPSIVRAISRELGIYRPESNDHTVVFEGKSFCSQDDTTMMNQIDELVMMGRSRPEDVLMLVRCLKNKGHIVAFFGGSTPSDTPTLEEADVGICDWTCMTEIARNRSDIVILSKTSITSILKLSKFVYQNIQIFIQLQQTTCISGLVVTSVATIFHQQTVITAVQLFWVNWIMCLLGGLLMVMKLQDPDQRPTNRNQPLVTKTMWENIIIQVLCQASVCLTIQFSGKYIRGMSDDVQKAMMFNIFSIMQVFNQFNVMNLLKKDVLLQVVVDNYYCFLPAVGAFMIVQLLAVQFMESLAGCTVKLNWLQWILCILLAAFSWGLDYLVKITANSISRHVKFYIL